MTGYLDSLQVKHQFKASEESNSQPILVISTDMVPPEFFRQVPGFPSVKTPNLDKLKQGGVEFTKAFCTAPVCSPSRAAFLTGRYSYITTNSERAHDGHEIHLRPDDSIFPEYLKAKGFYTRHHGKSHIGTIPFLKAFGENANPWDRWSPPWYDDDQYLAYLRDKNLRPFRFQKEIRGQALDGSKKGINYGGWIADQQGKPFPLEGTYPYYLVQKAIESLKNYYQEKRTRPLYLQLDFFAPHQPFAIPGGMETREAELRNQIDLTQYPLDTFDQEPRVYSLYRKNWGLQSNDVILDYLVANILQWELIDQALGHLFGYLESQNQYDDFWIFFLADHGEMNCRSRLVDKGAYLNPQVLRVPLIMKVPQTAPSLGPDRTLSPVQNYQELAGSRCDIPVSLVDLAPTIYEITQIHPSVQLDGCSLLETLRKQDREAHLPVMFEIWSHVVPNPCVGQIISDPKFGDVLFSYNACDPVDELYFLDSDQELKNQVEEHKPFHEQAIRILHASLEKDQRFRAYAGFLALEYSQIIPLKGDSQKFVQEV